jgi:branched-chain amino acid transport system substrate-binding protein
VAVIGHLQSYVTIPAAAIYDLAGLVLIAPTATDPALTAQGYHQVFRTTFSDQAVGEQLADFAVAHSYRRVAIAYIRDTYGRALANAFEERLTARGDTVIARDSYDPAGAVTEQMVSPMMRDWSTLTPDAVFLAGEVPSAATIVAEARREGIRTPILGGDAMSSPALVDVAGAAAEGVIVAAAFHPTEPGEHVERFVAAFVHRYGSPPDVGAALGYDAVSVLAAAIRQARSPAPAEVAAALHALKNWQGVTGPFSFDAAGNRVSSPIVTVVVHKGRFALLSDVPGPVASR